MPSDESTSTTISTFSNAHKSETWGINIIGNFVLNLYHRSVVKANDDWSVEKSELHKEYFQLVAPEIRQKLTKMYGTDNIGTLLSRFGFLINTIRGSLSYKIKCKTLFDFRNNKLKELDNRKINSDTIKQDATNDKEFDSILLNLVKKQIALEEDNFEIDETEPKMPLEYQASTIQRRLNSFSPTNMSCYICEEDFSTMESFEEHIQTHGEETDFEFLTTMDKFNSPIFTISYRLCKNSHNFCFEVETSLEDLIIEKIIIVQSRSFFYVHNTRVPYKCPESGINRFFVDSHLFNRHVEQPIILICHLEHSKDSRIIEQHHFMRSEEFPNVHFAINPYCLPDKKKFKPKFQLADYIPPKEIQEALKDDFYYKNLMQTSNEFRDYVRNGKNLQPQTIAASLNILLQIEDMDTIREYLSLKQKNIKLRSYGDEYSFQLKPQQRLFLENILTIYDEVILTTRTDIFTKTEEVSKLMMQNKSDIRLMENMFVGLIQAVNTGRISFKCDQKINIHDSYTVICRPSRLNFRYQYRSLEILSTNMEFLKNFLFPTKIIPMPMSSISLNLYNKDINSEQFQAVRNIAEGPRIDATYIIFGPPGTGKTTTLVESILQILRKPDTKILVTASSNSACDEVALRLCKYLNQLDIKRAMVRIYSRSSEIRTDTIDDELLENSNMYNGQFYPDVEILHEYRVVICTLSIVAKLATGKFGRRENGATLYTHLFIDEVAASTEVEALMAITTVLTPKSCLIISGDHKQLGPILQSKRAKELGLDVSLMDRLLARDCYRVDVDTGDYDRTIQTRLFRNYRSHPAIVNLYSGLFYSHTLEACAKPENVSLCEVWHKSRNKQYPILFHAIYEPSKSDNLSHSMYNLMELDVVMDYVKDLMYFGINGEPVNESDIGIISPYKKQYTRIREELNLRKWFNIETGSVETFQGKEKNIIIVSFVRSGTDNLGFLDDPRRLNVTISRPKSFLILIGNPKTLSLNSDFKYIIKQCQRHNTFIGVNGSLREDLKPQSTENLVMSQQKLFELKRTMQAPTLDIKDEEKLIEISKKNRRRGQNRRRNNFNINEKTNKENDVKKDVDIKDEDKKEGGEVGEVGEVGKVCYENAKADATASDAINFNNIEKFKNGYEVRQAKNGVAENECKILNERSRGGEKKQNLDKYNTDAIFNELPQVPKMSTQKTPPAPYTNDQLLLLQQQLHLYYNLQQIQKLLNYNNNPFFNVSTTSAYRPGLVHNPYITQQMQNFNSLALMQPLYFYNSTMSNNTNLLFGNNANVNTIPTVSSNNNNAAVAQQRSTRISKANKQSYISKLTESKDAFRKALTAAKAVDTLKAKNDTLAAVPQPLNYTEPTLSTTALSHNNAAEAYQITHISKATKHSDSAAIVEVNSLSSSIKDDFSENISAKNSSSNSTSATKKVPKIATNIHGNSSYTRDNDGSKSAESSGAFTKAQSADTLKYNRDTLVCLQPLNYCEPTFSNNKINKNLSCFKNLYTTVSNNDNAAVAYQSIHISKANENEQSSSAIGSKVIDGKNNLPSTREEDKLGETIAAKVNSSNATGATKKAPKIVDHTPGIYATSSDNTSSHSIKSRDAFNKTFTAAAAAVDTLKYDRDTLVCLQPLNYCEPTFSNNKINKNLSCFKNLNTTVSNNNNAAVAYQSIHISKANENEQSSAAIGSKVIDGKNNLPSTREEDKLGETIAAKVNSSNATGATKKAPKIVDHTPGIYATSSDNTSSHSIKSRDAFNKTFTAAAAAVDTLKYDRDTLVCLQPLNYYEPTFSNINKINKNLSCFKNLNTTVSNNNNAAVAYQSIHISKANENEQSSSAIGSKVIDGKNNLPSTREEDKLGETIAAKVNSSNATGATKKPPKIVDHTPGIYATSSDNTSSHSIKSRDAFNKTFTAAAAAVDTLKYDRDTLVCLQPLNYCEPTFSISANSSDIICSKSTKSKDELGKTFTPWAAADASIVVDNLKDETIKSANITKPLLTAPKVANKNQQQQKPLHTSERINLVSKEKSLYTTSSSYMTNTITLNRTDDKPKANVYPVLREDFNTFSAKSGNNVNYLAPSSSSSSSNVIPKQISSTSINNSSNITSKSNVSTSSYTSDAYFSSNTYNYNNPPFYFNSNTSNTQPDFEIIATDNMCSTPVRNLALFDRQKKEKKQTKKGKPCVIS